MIIMAWSMFGAKLLDGTYTDSLSISQNPVKFEYKIPCQ